PEVRTPVCSTWATKPIRGASRVLDAAADISRLLRRTAGHCDGSAARTTGSAPAPPVSPTDERRAGTKGHAGPARPRRRARALPPARPGPMHITPGPPPGEDAEVG